MPAAPKGLVIRSYQVGFGDCFLLSFLYARSEKHVLIDFGSTGLPKKAPRDQMARVAEDIQTVTGGQLHAVVATHRHRDHISGFDGKTGQVIASLKPEVVIQPWTEDPKAARAARQAKQPVQRNAAALGTILQMEAVSAHAAALARRSARGLSPQIRDQLSFIGEDNLTNKGAVTNLMKMGKETRYVQEGSNAGLGRLLPGVKVRVLGPPSLNQSEAIERYARKGEQEYWNLASRGGLAIDARGPFGSLGSGRVPRYARWFARQIRQVNAAQLLELVRELDDVLNNTSVILLFETQGQKFLFPGDAQLENWQHALSKHRERLKDVGVYKVGHHGSLNATPKTLWNLFDRKSTGSSPNRLETVMSTMDGKHGHKESHTEVPRETLVEALSSQSDLFDTRDLGKDELCWVIEFQF